MSVVDNVVSVRLDDARDTLILLDQTLLPGETKYLELTTQQQIWDAIYRLQVRGAPAIGIAAAYGVYLAAKQSPAGDWAALRADFAKAKEFLASARPTAVNLFWALDRMQRRLDACQDLPVADCKAALLEEAQAIRAEIERVLEVRRHEGVVHDQNQVVAFCNIRHLSDVGYVHHRVRRGLDVDGFCIFFHIAFHVITAACLLYTSPSPRD